MTHPNEELLRKGYAAFANADLETIQNLFADDIVWHVAGRSQIAGDYKGKDEVFGFLAKVITLSEGTFKIDLHDCLANDDHAVAITQATATRGGRTADFRGVTVYHVRDGKVTEAITVPRDPYLEDDFWS